jgi:hypothetical protein
MNINEFAYLAGYIDGDGCFYVRTYIQNQKILVFDYSIQVSSVDEDIIIFFHQRFGGVYSMRSEKREDRKDSYLWTVKTKQSTEIANQIIIFLVSKRKICELFLQVGNSIIPNCGIAIAVETISKRIEIFDQIKEEIHMNDRVSEEVFKSFKNIKKSIESSQEDLAYFAGLIDSEGCFRIGEFTSKRVGRNRSFISILEIGNTKSAIFPWLMQRFGGTIVYRKGKSILHNPMIIWSLKSKALHQILDKIHPFLRVKKERCEKLIELRNTTIPNGGDRSSSEFKNIQSSIQNKRKSIAKDLHKLNAKGKH